MEIVKGNDIKVVWAITKLVDNVSVPEDLSTASNIRFKVICSGTYIQVPDYSISGNEITFTIKGSAQRTGLYSFEVSYSKGYDARVVYKDAFTVVDLACQANYVKPDDIQVTTLEFYSCISSLYLWQLLDVEKSTTDNSVKNSLDDFYLGYDAKSKTWYGKQIPPETFKLEDMWRELDATNEIIPKHHLDLSGLTTEHYVDQVRQYLQEQIDDLSSRGGAVDEAQVTEIILRLLGRWFKEDENQDIYVVQKSVPKLDEEGNPVMDANGKPMYVEVGRGLYTTGFLSAKGKQTGSGGGGTGGGLIQTVYGSKDLGGTFKDDDLNNTFNAYTINAINTKTDNAVTLATEAKTLATTAKTAADNATTLANKAIADAKTANDKAQQAIDIASKFNRFFTAINASGGEIAADDTTTAIESIRANYSLWTNGYLSAKGQQQGSGGGTGGLVTVMYRWDDLGGTFDNNANDTFNAYTINRIYQLANIKLTTTGSGNAVTNITLGSGNLTVTKGESFATKAEFNTLNTKVTNFLEGTDTDDIINKWKELEAFLSGMKESDNLAAILATKADKSYVDSTFVTLATAQTITGAKTFTADLKTSNILPITNTTSSLGSDILRWLSGYYNSFIQIGDVRLEYDAAKTALKIIHKDGTTNVGLYSTGWLSAKGAQVGGSSGGGLISTIYRFSDLGGNFNDSNNDTFTAYTINEIWKIAQDSGIKNITITGSGNAITDLVPSSDGKTLTASKGITFATTASVTTLSNSKADKTITLTAGTGLTGGGDLSADRTFALATSGATAGTYTKVTVDAYGRVTKGAALAEGDIPNLSWSKITGKPTTIAGYGITDAYTKTETDAKYVTLATAQEISGGKTFLTDLRTSHILPSATGAKNLGGSTLRWLNTFTATLDATNVVVADSIRIGNGLIKWDSVNNAIYFVHTQADTTVGVYSTGWMSTMGVQVGGGSVSSLADLTDVTLTSPTNNQVLTYDSATSKWVNKTIQTGLDLTAMWNELKKADTTKVIDVSHIPNLPWSKITSGKPTTLAGYGITDAYTKAEADGRYVTALGTSGNNLTWTKNGTANNILVPYAIRAAWLNTDSSLTYGASGLNYFNLDGTAGTTPNANVTPTSAWYHILRMNHGNSNGYFADIAVPLNDTGGVWWRQIRGGNNYGWYKLLDSNNYDSTLGSVYVKKTGDTMTGVLTMANAQPIILNQSSATSIQYIRFQGGDNDFGRIAFGATGNNAGYLEIATADDGTEPIYVRQYTNGVFGSIVRTGTLLDGSGNTQFPGTVQANYFTCRNTTLCTNLNADLFDGYHSDYYVNLAYDVVTGQYNQYDYIEFLRITIPSGQARLADYVVFDLTRTETGSQMSGRAVIRIRRNSDNTASYNFYVTNFGISYLPEMKMTTDDGVTWKVWIKCIKGSYDPYVCIKVIQCYLWKNFTIQRNGVTGTPAGSKYNIIASLAGISHFADAFTDGSNHTTFVRKAGDSMTGDLTSTRMFRSTFSSTYWINSASDAIITANITGYGGIWCANTKNGRVFMSVYPSNNDEVYLGYASNSQISAGTNEVGTNTFWNAATGLWAANGYVKYSSSDAYVLLGGGGHKALSTMQSEYDARYVNVTGDTMSGALNFANGTRNSVGDDCGFGDGNVGGCTCFQGLNGDTGIALIQRGAAWSGGNHYRFTWNGSNMTSSSTAQWNNLNADLLDSKHESAFTSIIGRHSFNTDGTAPYAYIHLFRIANSHGYSTLRVDIDFKSRNHAATLYIDIVANQYPYNSGGTSINIYKETKSGRTCTFYVKQTIQSSNYNYYDIYYNSGAWNTGSYDVKLRGINGGFIFEPKNQKIDSLPSGCSTVAETSFFGNAASANQLYTARTINGTSFNGTANIVTSYWGTTRTFYTNSHDSYSISAGVSVNGSGNVTLLLPSSIRCSSWFRSTGATGWYNESYGGGIYMSDSTYVRVYNNKRFYVSNADNTDFSTATAISTAGGIYATKNITCNTNIYAKGAMTAKASSSDIRLKRDIKDFTAIDILRKIQPKQFYWNEIAKANSPALNNDYRQYGLIAQSIQNMPELEGFVDNVFKDYLIIHYEKFIPIALEGLKEVDDEVTKLKREVATLRQRIATLEGKSLSA